MLPELVTDLLRNGYKVSFSAPGHSMYPTILANETLVVEPVEPLDVHKGDIVLYRSNGNLIAHRVKGVVRDGKTKEYSTLLRSLSFILRGDAARTPDEPVTSEQVLGKVISVERNGHMINPYGLRHKLASWGHRWTACLKRHLFFFCNHQ
jgi:signal peptidase I